LHLESDVVFAGFRQDMPAVLAAMDMLVLPSASEACGRVVLEAMASSRAVLGTRTGGTPELIEDGVTGILFTPGNVEELAAHIDSLCADPGRAGAMGRAGRARACAEFSIDTAARSMEKIYEELSA
jgi:glycosyltransferase involved in cell wall biosynthesis